MLLPSRAPSEEAVDEYFVILDDVLNTSTLSAHSRGALEKYRLKNNISHEVHLECLNKLQWTVSDFEAGFKPLPNTHNNTQPHTQPHIHGQGQEWGQGQGQGQGQGVSTQAPHTHTESYSRTFSPYPAANYDIGSNSVLSQLKDLEK